MDRFKVVECAFSRKALERALFEIGDDWDVITVQPNAVGGMTGSWMIVCEHAVSKDRSVVINGLGDVVRNG